MAKRRLLVLKQFWADTDSFLSSWGLCFRLRSSYWNNVIDKRRSGWDGQAEVPPQLCAVGLTLLPSLG